MPNKAFPSNSSSESNSTQALLDGISRVFNVTVLSITVFILLSLIVHGTRRKRWTTPPAGSSLHSGMTFTCCVIATSFTLPRLITNEIVHYMRLSNRTILDCSVAGYISGAFYFIPQCGLYVFLCILLHKIYIHPYVKDKVKTCWRTFIPAFSIVTVIIILSAAVQTIRSMPVIWLTNQGCRYAKTTSPPLAAGIVSGGWVIVQTFIVSLYINAAFRTYLVSKARTGSEDGDEDYPNQCTDRCRIICPCGSKQTHFHSPVELTVRRSVYSVIVIVVSDVTLTVVTIYIVPLGGLDTFPSFLLDVSVLINVFSAIGALGCARDALGWWLPRCRKTISSRRKDNEHSRSVSEGNE